MISHSETGPRHRSVEIGVALAFILFGGIVIAGSLKVGINWGAEGPRAGFFPFYVGLLIVLCSALNLTRALAVKDGALFATWEQLRQVLAVVVPTAAYVALVPYAGIYVSSLLLIGLFMKWLGRYSWTLTLAVAVLVPAAFFLMFEKWFLVPLPKGPVEDFLGF